MGVLAWLGILSALYFDEPMQVVLRSIPATMFAVTSCFATKKHKLYFYYSYAVWASGEILYLLAYWFMPFYATRRFNEMKDDCEYQGVLFNVPEDLMTNYLKHCENAFLNAPWWEKLPILAGVFAFFGHCLYILWLWHI